MDKLKIQESDRNVVFLKTHKTSSTTTAGIFQRYGLRHNSTFLIPQYYHILSTHNLFNASKVKPVPQGVNINFLTNHIRFNRKEFDKVFKDAIYVTILRDTVSQFESSFTFNYLGFYLPANSRSIEAFLSDPETFYRGLREKRSPYAHMYRNYQIYDLGLAHEDMDNESIELETEFDLVMITEFYDESLILLKKLLNWDFPEVTYLSSNARVDELRANLSAERKAKIRQWNHADDLLYKHFNQTFWKKVSQYEGNFTKDLATFREFQAKLMADCVNSSHPFQLGERRVRHYRLRQSAPSWCDIYTLGDQKLTNIIRDRMIARKVPLYPQN
ncbi:galactosylceramide sulfotransferase-like [Diadema setosum]|uniref:galactosylceramide sulfotransferase-like n=1 Tax=Diadema setosum TaxID=31175 RepID=UPI003B3AB1E6